MPFIPSGKKAEKKRAARAKREAVESVLDKVIGRAQYAVNHAPGRCLPLCVLVERVLDNVIPGHQYGLHLGALAIQTPNGQPGAWDPRGPDGSPPPAGLLPREEPFHAWLERPDGYLVDPSIMLTLHAEGIDVDPQEYVLSGTRQFVQNGITFVYEVLPELQLVGLAESAAHLVRAVSFVLTGQPRDLGPNFLDVEWRTAEPAR